jgi:FKBP-type peptidyl-prolyl cis-trans isomerase FkpA
MLRLYTSLALVLTLTVTGVTWAAELETEEQKTLYALGIAVGRNLAAFSLSEEEFNFVQQGMADQVLGRPAKVDARTYQSKIQALGKERQSAAAEKEKAAGLAYRANAEKEEGVVKTDSGLLYKELQAGTGDVSPKATDRVRVHYHGTTIDGTVFDSSVERGQPATFPLNGVIKCWTEGVQRMKVGGKSRLICPPEIAYGDRGAPPRIKPGATLVFEVELIEITQKPAAQAPVKPPGHP